MDGASPEIAVQNAASGIRHQRGDGAATLSFSGADGATRLATLYHHDPCRVLFPNGEPDDAKLAVIATMSGGLAGGDRLAIDVSAIEGAKVTATMQAAEKIYRSLGPDTEVVTRLHVGAAARLEWLPHEAILFEGARLKRQTLIELDPGAELMAGEMAVFGRVARGEHFGSESASGKGFLHERWRVRLGGHLVWADDLLLEGAIAEHIAHPAGFDGAEAAATLIYSGPDASAFVALARSALEGATSRSGVTLVNGLLIARFLGKNAAALRADFASLWVALRAARGWPASLPRLWHI